MLICCETTDQFFIAPRLSRIQEGNFAVLRTDNSSNKRKCSFVGKDAGLLHRVIQVQENALQHWGGIQPIYFFWPFATQRRTEDGGRSGQKILGLRLVAERVLVSCNRQQKSAIMSCPANTSGVSSHTECEATREDVCQEQDLSFQRQ